MKKHDLILLLQIAYSIAWRVLVGTFAFIGFIEFYFTVIY